jgi:hypothetical protein
MPDTRPTIVVAGDICIDWLSVPVEPAVVEPHGPSLHNWQLRGGRHMYARRGGAWLTADYTENAVMGAAIVCKPEDRRNLEAVSPDEVVHSMLMLDRFPRQGSKDAVLGLRVFEGFAGPADGRLIRRPPAPHCDDAEAAIIVLDDAGNGFRDDPTLWPLALDEGTPLVVYKVRRPLLRGALWERLASAHLGRTVVVLNADELRAEGAIVSRHLSWEQTAADLVLALAHNSTFATLKKCAHIIVPFGLEGVVHFRGAADPAVARLWYVPDLIENDLKGSRGGDMSGVSCAFTAAIAARLAATAVEDRLEVHTVAEGIDEAMVVARYVLEAGFGVSGDFTKHPEVPEYPVASVFRHETFPGFLVETAPLPRVPELADAESVEAFQNWRILDVKRRQPLRDLARDVAIHGLDRTLPTVPVARFGGFETVDRREIESYRGIRNLIREFLKNPRHERPLSFAVFGRPGSGKSYGVTQVAKAIDSDGLVERLDFNLSQWESPAELVVALHRVRDSNLRGKTPLVFFDEFDCNFRGQLGWLRHFLAPMQEGVFSENHLTHLIGRAIFVFAGGTCSTFEEFAKKAVTQSADAKIMDFLGRLRGYVNVFDVGSPADPSLLRRAMLLRATLNRKCPRLFDAHGTLRVDPAVLAAFLNVPTYRHGVRSIEALIDMSQLQDRDHFDTSLLPSSAQMCGHVDSKAFARVLRTPVLLARRLEELARAIHARDLAHAVANVTPNDARDRIRERQASREWDGLDEIYRNSSRDQAAHIPVKLALIGCDLAPIDARSADFRFQAGGVWNALGSRGRLHLG